jgi:hypothetical protein
VPSLAPRNQYRHAEGCGREGDEREPRQQHRDPYHSHRLSRADDPDDLLLGCNRYGNDQLATDLTVRDRAGRGTLDNSIAGLGPLTSSQPQADVINANLLIAVVGQLDGIVMREVRIHPHRCPQSCRLQLAPFAVEQRAAYDHRQRYGEQQQGYRHGRHSDSHNALAHASIMAGAGATDRSLDPSGDIGALCRDYPA